MLAQPTGEEHPTPDSVPARKSSIIQGENKSILSQTLEFEELETLLVIGVILSHLVLILKHCIVAGPNTGAPAGHPVGQPLPNPAMARLLWSL